MNSVNMNSCHELDMMCVGKCCRVLRFRMVGVLGHPEPAAMWQYILIAAFSSLPFCTILDEIFWFLCENLENYCYLLFFSYCACKTCCNLGYVWLLRAFT